MQGMAFVSLYPFRQQQDENIKQGQATVGETVEVEGGRAACMTEIVPCLADVFRAEDDPADQNKEEGTEDLTALFDGREQVPVGYYGPGVSAISSR